MIQLGKLRTVLYHLYPGVVITSSFVLLAPVVVNYGFPSQFAMLISIAFVALPILISHLVFVKKLENKETVSSINGFTDRLTTSRLLLYSVGLTLLAFTIWGLTHPINTIISDTFLNWLPDWFTVQNFNGFSKDKIRLTLLFNLALNGVIAPYVEELYFRGYLLPRMNTWGKNAFFINAILFSFYHFWQPYIYFTLILALLPVTYLTWRTKDIRLAILTHCLLNVVGALLSFGTVL